MGLETHSVAVGRIAVVSSACVVQSSFGGKVGQKGVMKGRFEGGKRVLGQELSRNGNMGSEKGRSAHLPADLGYLGDRGLG